MPAMSTVTTIFSKELQPGESVPETLLESNVNSAMTDILNSAAAETAELTTVTNVSSNVLTETVLVCDGTESFSSSTTVCDANQLGVTISKCAFENVGVDPTSALMGKCHMHIFHTPTVFRFMSRC